ncbi:MAG TPA: hypothetical protein VKC60_00380 [Opitutaceae bacterium]|nr:hypothetical protein [Opitutaceae bacterium]
MACCKIGITNLELAVRKQGDLSVAAAKEIISKRIGDLIEIKPTKDTLIYDPKPPMELTDANDEPGKAA